MNASYGGMAKARMRSWMATDNDLKNAIDIKEGIKYSDRIKNSKVAVAEIIPALDDDL